MPTTMPIDTKLLETLATVSYLAGFRSYWDKVEDSRDAIQQFIGWAEEFQEMHKDTDWNATDAPDYITEIDKFTEEKINQATDES